MSITAPADSLLNTEEVALRLGISKSAVRNLIAGNRLAVVRIGRTLRITESSVNQFITDNTQ
jgi:excisionase family DNA binding protein